MMLAIADVLNEVELAQAGSMLASAHWGDGRVTAGHQSAQVKNNLQLPQDGEEARALGEIVLRALERNALFVAAALPRHVYPPLFNRYAQGMSFGDHVDNAIRPLPGSPHRIRTDLSATLFLNAPEDYDGGELSVEGGPGIKLSAGSMILYPSTSLHSVTQVTRGARIACFFWVQSMVKDAGERKILFDLDRAIVALGGSGANPAELARLTSVYHNLIRKWGEV